MKKLLLISLLLLFNFSFSQPSAESVWIKQYYERLYGMPENLSDLKLKFEIFGETPPFVMDMINSGEEVNDSMIYKGPRAEDNLIKSAKYLKASSKDQIAVKNFLISLVITRKIWDDGADLKRIGAYSDAISYIDKAIKANKSIDFFYLYKARLILDFYNSDVSLSEKAKEFHKQKIRSIKSLKKALNKVNQKSITGFKSLMSNFDDSVDENDFNFENAYPQPFGYSADLEYFLFSTDAEKREITNVSVLYQTLCEAHFYIGDYKNAAKYYQGSAEQLEYKVMEKDLILKDLKSNDPTAAYLYYKNGEYTKALETFNKILKEESFGNPMVFGEEVLKKYINKDDKIGEVISKMIEESSPDLLFDGDSIWDFGFGKDKVYYVAEGLELVNSGAVEKVPDEYIIQLSWENKYLISIFYKSLCLNKIGEIDKSEMYFNFFKSLYLLDNNRDGLYFEIPTQIENERINREINSLVK